MEYKQWGTSCKIVLLIKNRQEIVFLVMKISQLPSIQSSIPFEIPHFEEQRINLSRWNSNVN